MADRRAKQLAFEQKRLNKLKSSVNEDRELTLYTASIHFKETPEVDHVFDLSSVQLDINFPTNRSALESDIFEEITSISKFKTLLDLFVAKIEAKDFTTVLITCVHGMHRSVAMAESIKKKYPKSSCHHLMLE